MANKVYPKRYAQAVFELAVEKNELDRWQADLEKLVTAAQDSALIAALSNPKTSLGAKAGLLSRQVTGISPLATNLANLLITRGGFNMIKEIAQEYRRLVDRQRGIEQADVVTAVPLDEAAKQKLAARFSALSGKKVILNPAVNPGIGGGIIVKVGGKLLDGSTRSRLAALKNALAGTG